MRGSALTTHIRPQPGILDIAPYKGGASGVRGVADVVKLSSNENPFGASERALAAWARAGRELHRYPDGSHAGLRAAIGEAHGLDPERIVCGAGSDELLGLLAQAYAGEGDEVLHTEHGFGMYPIVARAAGAQPVRLPERERVVDVDAILARACERTRVVFVANPANPTGTMLPPDDLARLAHGLPPHVLLVLDGAYAEYAEGYDGGAALVEAGENVVMTRTFSKIYGLGGLRVGWAYAPRAVVEVLNRIRMPFNLGRPQLAVAEAAVRDGAWVSRCRAENARLREWMAEALGGLGVRSDPSHANFVLARFGSPEEAAACDAHLAAEGLLVRPHGQLRPRPGPAHHRGRRAVVPARRARGGPLPRRALRRRPERARPALTGAPHAHVALIGLGLIASSMALAIRARGLAARVTGYDHDPAVRDEARALGLCEVAEGPAEAVRGADLVVLAVPVGAMGEVARAVAPHLGAGATLTDVGSVKRAVIDAVSPHVPEGVAFVPGHPLAGTERSGAARGPCGALRGPMVRARAAARGPRGGHRPPPGVLGGDGRLGHHHGGRPPRPGARGDEPRAAPHRLHDGGGGRRPRARDRLGGDPLLGGGFPRLHAHSRHQTPPCGATCS